MVRCSRISFSSSLGLIVAVCGASAIPCPSIAVNILLFCKGKGRQAQTDTQPWLFFSFVYYCIVLLHNKKIVLHHCSVLLWVVTLILLVRYSSSAVGWCRWALDKVLTKVPRLCRPEWEKSKKNAFYRKTLFFCIFAVWVVGAGAASALPSVVLVTVCCGVSAWWDCVTCERVRWVRSSLRCQHFGKRRALRVAPACATKICRAVPHRELRPHW